MGLDIVEMHDVDVFVVQVEKVGFMNKLRAVERALLDDRDVESVRIGVHRAGADASRRAFAAYDETADAEQAEVRQERRALKDAGALFIDDDVGRLRRKGVIDAVVLGVGGFLLAVSDLR